MRITFVVPPVDMSGGIRVISIYAERLAKRGHEVLVVSVPPEVPSMRQMLRTLVRERRWIDGKVRPMSHFDESIVSHRRLDHPAPITDGDVPDGDVVIATWWETAEWVGTLSPRKGVKVHFVQGWELFGGPIHRVEGVYRTPIPKIVVSNWLAEMMTARFAQRPLAVVPNSVETDKFFAPPRHKQEVPTAGMIYAPMGIKGTDVSLQAYLRAKEQLPNLRLVILSNHEPVPQLPVPAGAEYIYRAREAALRQTYARCDVWLFGSREEGFGLPILEAMACRTPVVATPAGAAPELLAKGGGRLVPMESSARMAEAVVEICSMPDPEWLQLSEHALRTATDFSWDDATSMFELALDKACVRAGWAVG